MPIATRHTHLVTRLVVIAVVLAGLVGCTAKNADGSGEQANIGSPATLTTSTSTSTTAAASTSIKPPPVQVGAATPEAATAALYLASVAGDRSAAASVAEPAAIDAVFAAPPGAYQSYSRCDTGEFDTSGCLYRDRSNNNTIQFDMERRANAWVVTGAFVSAS